MYNPQLQLGPYNYTHVHTTVPTNSTNSLEENGGTIKLNKEWARSVLICMGYSKRQYVTEYEITLKLFKVTINIDLTKRNATNVWSVLVCIFYLVVTCV